MARGSQPNPFLSGILIGMTIRRAAAVLATALLLVVPLWAGPSSQAASYTATQVKAADKLELGLPASQRSTKTDKAELGKLKVAKVGSMSGFARAKFPHWRDASKYGWPAKPNNRCNARNAALYRDGQHVKVPPSCTGLTGSWLDPYTAKTYPEASDIDIDHLVPLAEAWRSGANHWSTAQRRAYANNPMVLVSVQDRANESKGDKDPAAWKPANKASWCLYAKHWIAIKYKYKLTIDKSEKSALSSMLGTCGR